MTFTRKAVRCSVTAIVFLLLAVPLQAADPVNLDFEAGLDERGRPVGWIGGAPGYALGVDPAAHGGELSARLQGRENETTAKTSAPLVQFVSAEPWRGKRVRLSGWLRTQDVATQWAGLWMRIDSETAPGLSFDNMPDRGPRGTTDWARYEVVLDVPKEAFEIYFGVVLLGNGTVWADDLLLEEVAKSVPVTGSPKKGKE
ncbi:MAG TPA: hypothetical protein VEK57_01590 [Thermoanaerobaculia bacterium]|nr:hypothetical protein [Thermoanaerobaculia bacterium]